MQERQHKLNRHTKQSIQHIVQNIWDANKGFCEQCICPKAPSNLSENKRTQFCYRCRREYHSDCYWPKEKDCVFQCPFCYLISCRPEKAVKQVVFAGYLPNIKKQKVQYKLNLILNQSIKRSKGEYIEIRCVKFNTKNRYQISWPDGGHLYINSHKIFEFVPLSANSPLKRRNDDCIRVNQIKDGKYQITIEQKSCSQMAFKVNKRCNHLVMVVLVADVTEEQLWKQLQQNKQDIEQSKKSIKCELQRDIDGLTFEKLLIPLKCHYYGDTIKIPARSVICSHFQPFDLMSMIISSVRGKGNTRAWKCPICDKRAYNIVIDSYLLCMIEKYNSPKQIIFKKDAQAQMREVKQNVYLQILDDKEVEQANNSLQKEAAVAMNVAVDVAVEVEINVGAHKIPAHNINNIIDIASNSEQSQQCSDLPQHQQHNEQQEQQQQLQQQLQQSLQQLQQSQQQLQQQQSQSQQQQLIDNIINVVNIESQKQQVDGQENVRGQQILEKDEKQEKQQQPSSINVCNNNDAKNDDIKQPYKNDQLINNDKDCNNEQHPHNNYQCINLISSQSESAEQNINKSSQQQQQQSQIQQQQQQQQQLPSPQIQQQQAQIHMPVSVCAQPIIEQNRQNRNSYQADFKQALDGYRQRVDQRRRKQHDAQFVRQPRKRIQREQGKTVQQSTVQHMTVQHMTQNSNNAHNINRADGWHQNSPIVLQEDSLSECVHSQGNDEQQSSIIKRVIQAHQSLRTQKNKKTTVTITDEETKAFQSMFHKLLGNYATTTRKY